MENNFGVIIAFFGGWVGAQLIKTALKIKNKGLKSAFEISFNSGGMPSGHTAGVIGALTFLIMTEGIYSPLTQFAAGISLIVIYDAINVRFAVGEQGKILAEFASKIGYTGKLPRIVKGHTIPQVIVGGILGVLVGLATYYWIF
jgi:acid phosphatase family membrane protein YuiD